MLGSTSTITLHLMYMSFISLVKRESVLFLLNCWRFAV